MKRGRRHGFFRCTVQKECNKTPATSQKTPTVENKRRNPDNRDQSRMTEHQIQVAQTGTLGRVRVRRPRRVPSERFRKDIDGFDKCFDGPLRRFASRSRPKIFGDIVQVCGFGVANPPKRAYDGIHGLAARASCCCRQRRGIGGGFDATGHKAGKFALHRKARIVAIRFECGREIGRDGHFHLCVFGHGTPQFPICGSGQTEGAGSDAESILPGYSLTRAK